MCSRLLADAIIQIVDEFMKLKRKQGTWYMPAAPVLQCGIKTKANMHTAAQHLTHCHSTTP
jgi:hypothetical protein